MNKMHLTLLLTLLPLTNAWADRDEHQYRAGTVLQANSPLWKQECGSCHVAFPPAMLPAATWRTMMGGLKDHFGSDASLPAAEEKAITEFLVANAGRAAVDAKAPMRITRTPWFLHEHREVPVRVWQRPAVKSPANCQACHRQAEQGDYSERRIRIPK